ncbi:CRISPR-associated endonuclease Cas1 [Methanosarcinaceae archaeon Ag5]|uniref:CRISPR-associated endonuclease Cas1 n=1 Tax=Methanolapillus africanus TaxID=3028297 RepID=A0AAE4ML60_9EURY|nr:CRISPR-associated endonuclease Cas1 [Methanosarcinaceae archaeon Ag5]
MKTDYYITNDGTLKRHENTVYFENTNPETGEVNKRAIPINKIYCIHAYGRLTLSSGVIDYLAKHGVPIHYYNYYGFYEGSFYPRETLVSGDVTVCQASHYLDQTKRLILAKKFVEGGSKNILRNLKYYSKEDMIPVLSPFIENIEKELDRLPDTNTIPEIMNVEGRIRNLYYNAFDEIVPEEYQIVKRTRMPPENKMNTLISFGNSVLYSTILSEIYNTQANPTISFLHEPFVRRFSLSLDVSEIFKPIIVDRIIFKLVNKNMLDDSCFSGNLGNMLLSEKGKKIFLKEYDEKLDTTIMHRNLKRKVSYKNLIRYEIYKLIKHFIEAKEYNPLVMWW